MEYLTTAKSQSWLPWFLRGVIILGFVVIFVKIFELQIIKGEYYRDLSNGNRVREVVLAAPRGNILARGGEALATNKEIKKIIIFDPKEGYSLSEESISTWSDSDDVVSQWERIYPLGEKVAHVVGYLSLTNPDEAGKVDPNCTEKGVRSATSYVGRMGLERQYNCSVSGADGRELIEVDTLGKKVRVLGTKDPIKGDDLKTTIDYGLQGKVAEVMNNKNGAVVATDTKGEILALFSSPSFDPNVFSDSKNKELVNILNDTSLPLFNRAIGGLYHPGSVFKQLIAVAGLEEGVIDKDYRYEDTGVIKISSPYGEFNYTNWYLTQYGGVEGKIGLVKAITRSTDTFFYKLGELIGIDNIVQWAERFHLNDKTDIDIPGEVKGLIPSPTWKEQVKGEKWFLGNTYHVSIGQGDLALTPILVNTLTSTVASGGKLCNPKIAGESKCTQISIKKQNIDLIKEGMAGACSEGGTAYPFFNFNPLNLESNKRVACKTGTAETIEEGITHAWFTVFAPVDNPEIVVTVLVEKGGEGSKVAAPIAREIMDYYFSRKLNNNH